MSTVCPHWGHLLYMQQHPHCVSCLLLPLTVQEELVFCFCFFNVDSVGRLCMGATVSDTNDKSLSECITCTIRTLPVLIFCLSAGVSVRTRLSSTGIVTFHLISSSNPGLDFSALFLSASLPALVTGHSFHTQLNEPFKTQGVANLYWF